MQGGDICLKRALYRSLEANQDEAEFDFSQLIGDLSINADMSFYQQNKIVIDASIALAPDSALAQGWVLTQLRAAEMDIDRFYKSDFYGGLGGFLDGSNHLFGESFAPAAITLARGAHGDVVLGDAAVLSGALAQPEGWSDIYRSESRWAAVTGPDGRTVTAMRTGQFAVDPDVTGGGGQTGGFTIEETKAYEYTIYVRKADLARHEFLFGAANSMTVNAVSGVPVTATTFTRQTVAQQAALADDRWYKVVGVILPEGDEATSHAQYGGIFDTVTGEKVGNTTAYAWNPNRTTDTSYLRFYNSGDEASHDNSSCRKAANDNDGFVSRLPVAA